MNSKLKLQDLFVIEVFFAFAFITLITLDRRHHFKNVELLMKLSGFQHFQQFEPIAKFVLLLTVSHCRAAEEDD